MPAPYVKNVASQKPYAGGGVYYGPLTSALPTDASTALIAAYKPLGYVSDAGVKPSRDTKIDKKTAWGGDIVAALLTDDSRSFEFTLLEVFSDEVSKWLYGASNVTVTAATTATGTKVAVLDKAYKPDNCVLVFDMKYGAKRRRLVVAVADVSVSGEEPYTDGDLTGYTVTVEALKDGTGVRVYDYLENDDHT